MEKFKNMLAVAIVIVFLPYVITILMNGRTASQNSGLSESDQIVQVVKEGTTISMNLNEYILGMTAGQMDVSYETEALAAQAVIVRTTLFYEAGEAGLDDYVFEHNYLSYHEMETLWERRTFQEYYDKLEDAVQMTDGLVITCEGEVIDAAYHAVSSGMTRNGEDAFGVAGYEYLASKECEADVESEQYLNLEVFTADEIIQACQTIHEDIDLEEENLIDQIVIQEVDDAGYVKKLKAGDAEISGEEFRQILGLSSSCFSLQEYNGNIRITARGTGHGVGLSQYTANKMAEQGDTYEEILNFFYENIELELYDH